MSSSKFPDDFLNPAPTSSTSASSSAIPKVSSPSPSSSKPTLFNHHKPLIRVPENLTQNYCYRHHPEVGCNRQADAKQMQEIQQQLDTLNTNDRTSISHVWSIFSAAPATQRSLMLKGLLAQCCFPQLSQVSEMLDNLIRIDFLTALPPEIGFQVLFHLDSASLCQAAQVSKRWKLMADDDIVWHRMCEQHIDKKCTKCGWGLPLLERRRLRQWKKEEVAREVQNSTTVNSNDSSNSTACNKPQSRKTRPWKHVYRERFNIEANWRNGRYKSLTFKHKSPILCLQFDEQFLITGSYDGSVAVWDIETGKLLRQLEGHLTTVTALKFDSLKLITASRDQTVCVWNYRTGDRVCTFRGHEGPVLCIDCNKRLIASGSADNNIKVWDFSTKTCFTLRGHTDWVQSVKVHSESGTLYSGSQDTTIRMWDLKTKTCLAVFGGSEFEGAHVAQIQTVIPLYIDHCLPDTSSDNDNTTCSNNNDNLNTLNNTNNPNNTNDNNDSIKPTHILSASLDSTIKLWDIRTGTCVRTLFGHIEGIWGLAADTFRIVSGSHDKSVKVWDLQTGKNWHTFSIHSSHVTCVGLSDTRLAAGSDDGVVKMLCFDDFSNEEVI